MGNDSSSPAAVNVAGTSGATRRQTVERREEAPDPLAAAAATYRITEVQQTEWDKRLESLDISTSEMAHTQMTIIREQISTLFEHQGCMVQAFQDNQYHTRLLEVERWQAEQEGVVLEHRAVIENALECRAAAVHADVSGQLDSERQARETLQNHILERVGEAERARVDHARTVEELLAAERLARDLAYGNQQTHLLEIRDSFSGEKEALERRLCETQAAHAAHKTTALERLEKVEAFLRDSISGTGGSSPRLATHGPGGPTLNAQLDGLEKRLKDEITRGVNRDLATDGEKRRTEINGLRAQVSEQQLARVQHQNTVRDLIHREQAAREKQHVTLQELVERLVQTKGGGQQQSLTAIDISHGSLKDRLEALEQNLGLLGEESARDLASRHEAHQSELTGLLHGERAAREALHLDFMSDRSMRDGHHDTLQERLDTLEQRLCRAVASEEAGREADVAKLQADASRTQKLIDVILAAQDEHQAASEQATHESRGSSTARIDAEHAKLREQWEAEHARMRSKHSSVDERLDALEQHCEDRAMRMQSGNSDREPEISYVLNGRVRNQNGSVDERLDALEQHCEELAGMSGVTELLREHLLSNIASERGLREAGLNSLNQRVEEVMRQLVEQLKNVRSSVQREAHDRVQALAVQESEARTGFQGRLSELLLGVKASLNNLDERLVREEQDRAAGHASLWDAFHSRPHAPLQLSPTAQQPLVVASPAPQSHRGIAPVHLMAGSMRLDHPGAVRETNGGGSLSASPLWSPGPGGARLTEVTVCAAPPGATPRCGSPFRGGMPAPHEVTVSAPPPGATPRCGSPLRASMSAPHEVFGVQPPPPPLASPRSGSPLRGSAPQEVFGLQPPPPLLVPPPRPGSPLRGPGLQESPRGTPIVPPGMRPMFPSGSAGELHGTPVQSLGRLPPSQQFRSSARSASPIRIGQALGVATPGVIS